MSIFRKIELAFIGLLLAGIVGLSAYALYLRNSKEHVQENYQQASGNAAAAQTANAALKTVVIEKEQAHGAVQEVIERNPEWADAPLPADAAALLREPAGSAE